jgi:nitroreductase
MKPEEMRIVAEFASLAPSVHNTQPWRFVARTDALDVLGDFDRALSYLDPDGRQLHLSCGAATELARLAIRSLGYQCTVEIAPEPSEPTLVARIVTVGRAEATGSELRLIDAAARRYTDRGPYTDEPVTRGELAMLRTAVDGDGCWLKVLDRAEDRVAAIMLLSDAEAAEAIDTAYRSELAQWRRDGHAADGLPEVAYVAWADPTRVTDVPLRDFTGMNDHPRPGDAAPPLVERDTIVLLGTDVDSVHSWVGAGIALARLLLTLTVANLVGQPLGPVFDVPATRARLRHEVGLVGYPQLMLRIGHGVGKPATGRRPSTDTFVIEPL